MRNLLIISILIFGCSGPKQITTTKIKTIYDTVTETYYNDTIIYITTPITRQERKLVKHKLKHERIINSDSMDYKLDKYELMIDAYKDSLKYDKRKHNKVVNKEAKRTFWYVWMLFGGFIVLFLNKLLT